MDLDLFSNSPVTQFENIVRQLSNETLEPVHFQFLLFFRTFVCSPVALAQVAADTENGNPEENISGLEEATCEWTISKVIIIMTKST